MTGRERGNVTVLTVGFLAVLGMLVVVVVNASAAFLERRELMNLADRVALHAADGLDRDAVYSGGIDEAAVLDAADARALVVGVVPADVRMTLSTTDDRVDVELVRTVTLPLVPPGFPRTATIRAAASGRLHLAP
ncbi:pilus assembly protein TadG-related protein [Aeromicrobium duanguangcaii]|uniref:Pilus assembly protein TadG-related protein n=1 Tax=Aeromicrobium duanguangcaii TaxID=2968086 RepID=A0ABY5KHW6_9ACTN|nr:pilus assembly protein TadG-related protein [Aeromicrobium duanguangcaii]MCD9154627.1 pilus assembly protein TadG-related protein [Aeromicrobium duanguangcaii]MCL3838749.1 pilus assembly protein TadG-related protein [Aeromicrobium duanguangcaii]UUI67958.1 pilus assembly protein TadG-related protein [Aeromicrobium duanguangcaii]